ncbi:hypothetical protein [[Actinomadura] parvosata]|uniref:hypothetical protein n=1 Tax=[Actinomadura] parvosata TaxID=1955412 RepID=UPI001E5FF995|nr:hypothetical protein [Nonomuraea sp. ATCC 55076]
MGRLRTYGFVAGFLAVPLVLYTVFVISPYVQAFQLSLTSWNGYSSVVRYVGLDNFGRLLEDEVFWRALRNHGILLLVLPLATIVIALLFAFLLNLGAARAAPACAGCGAPGSTAWCSSSRRSWRSPWSACCSRPSTGPTPTV